MRPVVAKLPLHRRLCEAVVMDADDKNRILFRSGLGWNKRGKQVCAEWVAAMQEP